MELPFGNASYTDAKCAETLASAQSYSDSVASGLDIKESVRVATNAALPACTRTGNVLTADANGALPAIDTSVTCAVNDRILVKNQATTQDNGIYVVTALGGAETPWILTRANDANSSAEVTSGLFCMVSEGANAPKGWVLTTNDPIVLNTTGLTFAQFTPYPRDQLLGANGSSGSDVCTKAGTSLADESCDISAKILSVRTGIGGTESEKLYVNRGGGLVVTGNVYSGSSGGFQGGVYGHGVNVSSYSCKLWGGWGLTSASNVHCVIGASTTDAGTPSTAKLLSIRTGITGTEVEKANIKASGEIEIIGAGVGIILRSPDGTAYRLTIANGGTVSVAAV